MKAAKQRQAKPRAIQVEIWGFWNDVRAPRQLPLVQSSSLDTFVTPQMLVETLSMTGMVVVETAVNQADPYTQNV